MPWGVDALGGAVTEPAWRAMSQRAMSERAKATVTETPGSHAVYVSRPAVVAAVISQAAQGLNDQP